VTAPTWTQDPRWLRAQRHAQRGEVLQAELLLRDLVGDHADCVPGWHALADFAAERGDLDTARHCVGQALTAAPDDTELLISQARLQVVDGRIDEAQKILQRVVRLTPDHGVAWLMLAEVREAQGDSRGALHARHQAITRSQKAGRWVSEATTDPALL
jgi:predicted Zn-dependent protease